MKKLVILKLGGSVITKKASGKIEVDEGNLKRLAKEVADAKKAGNMRLLIVHGGGAFGHIPAKKYGLTTGLKDERQKEGFSVTHQSMERLNLRVVEALQENGVNAVSYQPSAVGVMRDKKLVYFPTDVLERIIELDMVPVSYGDALLDNETGINILSGDHLVAFLAEKLNAERIVIAADVDGIFDSDPKVNKGAKLIKKLAPEKLEDAELSDALSTDVTGGMRRKVEELMVAAKAGVESEIVNSLQPGNVERALLGEKGIGTTIGK